MEDFKQLFKFREDTKDNFTEGGICVAHQLFYGLFKSPYVLWRMSCKYLKNIRNEAFLDIEKIDKPLPFITFLFRFIFDFLLQALTYISVIIAPIAAIYATIRGIVIIDEHSSYHISYFFRDLIGTFAAFYYAPIALRLIIELLMLVRKYGQVILKYVFNYIFFPIIVLYNFLSYLANKCKYKAEKYDHRINELNKQ